MDLELTESLDLERCPHCNIAKPLLKREHAVRTVNDSGTNRRLWIAYLCSKCGGMVTAYALDAAQRVINFFPSFQILSENIPTKPREFLKQAIESIHAPSGAKMLCASSVDAMLKEKGYNDGHLYTRINQARDEHVITPEMALWAHEVRLEANNERHADEDAELPTQEQAERMIEFTKALAELLFVLPAKVQRGIENAQGTPITNNETTR